MIKKWVISDVRKIRFWHEAPSAGGWKKYRHNPVLGGELGTIFDVCVLREESEYRMWVSWRPEKSIALFKSSDGINWTNCGICLKPDETSNWESDVNRPVVVRRGDCYHMWYTGQANGHSWIGYATSTDGVAWNRMSIKPVLSPECEWEKVAVMCPHVIWDDRANLFRMWYSAGEQWEPDAIGYATSKDGVVWEKYPANPIFKPDPVREWERFKVAGAYVLRCEEWHYLFYIGFTDLNRASIGIARSANGIDQWERHPKNPIIRPGRFGWDCEACYKPSVQFDGRQWLLWYNGRRGDFEQIGLAAHSKTSFWSS